MNEEEQAEVTEAPEEVTPEVAPAAAEEFPFVVIPPLCSFAVREIPPPASSYIGPDDYLSLEVRNSIAAQAISFHWRLLRADGQLILGSHTYSPTADRAVNTWVVRLAEGFLLGAVVGGGSTAKPGAVYARLLLLRGGGGGVAVAQVLLAGYVVAGAGLVWPYPRYQGPAEGPGRLRLLVGTNPAPGSYIVEEVPSGARWRIVLFYCEFTTSAVVANRYVHFWIGTATAYYFLGAPLLAVPANSSYRFEWAPGVDARVLSGLDQVQDALPEPLVLSTGMRFGVLVSGLQAGDDFGAPNYMVEEWLEP